MTRMTHSDVARYRPMDSGGPILNFPSLHRSSSFKPTLRGQVHRSPQRAGRRGKAGLRHNRNGVGSIADFNVLTTQLLPAKKASTDVYSTALPGGGFAGVGDRLSPP